jgi:hypothetical protein
MANLCSLKGGEDIFVDGVAYREVCSKISIILLFQQLDDAIADVESAGDEIRSLFPSGESSSDRMLGQTSQNWQESGIIQVDWSRRNGKSTERSSICLK